MYQSVEGLPAEYVWKRTSPTTLSIGNILMHVCGSEHQWIGNKLGGIPLERDRDLEMSATHGKDVGGASPCMEYRSNTKHRRA
ncbi:hypothetical protein EH198_12935 [Paenibacillus rhizophilus]|uniref:DUF664 domain-containing protein n=1 Tax=Paenibacillus rhizophilus TaxID=1850366 RepID=A0A3N9P4W5_9BACL|nr:hypothetical protein EH198_12935 [Paenibacillus rhizophilus]